MMEFIIAHGVLIVWFIALVVGYAFWAISNRLRDGRSTIAEKNLEIESLRNSLMLQAVVSHLNALKNTAILTQPFSVDVINNDEGIFTMQVNPKLPHGNLQDEYIATCIVEDGDHFVQLLQGSLQNDREEVAQCKIDTQGWTPDSAVYIPKGES